MKLLSKIKGLSLNEPVVLRVRENPATSPARSQEILLVDTPDGLDTAGFGLVLQRPTLATTRRPVVSADLNYLKEGDILRFSPEGDVWVMYRRHSPHNAMLVTERCNSRCVMCSQPPKPENDDHLIQDWLKAIPLMASETKELCITGGEPTLLHDRLLSLISAVKQHLPGTSLHMLSNGRLFSYLKYAERIAEIEHSDFMIGIPLYSDVDHLHDYVVQAKGAFGQTIKGLLNLGRVRQRVEIRFVIHKQTYRRLPHFARFVVRNLPFVNHVALMGLEIMGFARSNLNALWVDPVEYQQELEEAIWELNTARLKTSIYNLPLCLVPKAVWPITRRSISDWKNIYFDECSSCSVRDLCAGFFASSTTRRSPNVHPLSQEEREQYLAQEIPGRAAIAG